MSRFELPIYATLSLCAGPFLFARSFRDLRTRRLIQNTPTARIRSMAMGLVEINGNVEMGSHLTAPFSGRPCAYWEVDISTPNWRRQGWSVVHRNASGHPFMVRDDTGVATIYPQGAECRVRQGVGEECVGLSLPECYASYLREQGLFFRHVWQLSVLRFRERILEEGMRVYVLGTAMPRAEAHDISHDEVLEATGTDGAVDTRLRALQEETVSVVRRGDNVPTFIISQESERELTLGLGFRAAAQLMAGPVLTLFGLGYWLYWLGALVRR